MLVGARQSLWQSPRREAVVTVEMTPGTGLFIRLNFTGFRDRTSVVDWGDGTAPSVFSTTDNLYVSHTYGDYGRYRIACRDVARVGLRFLDGQPSYAYDAAILSVVDESGTMTMTHSGGFKGCANLERYISPGADGFGQRTLANCPRLREVVIGPSGTHFDGALQNCTALESFACARSWVCWSYVWKGCTNLRLLRLGEVSQLATQDFADTPNLRDIYISNRTVAQITQTAASGNIVAGYGARFPWGADAECRFHGTDGVVLGNGTVL